MKKGYLILQDGQVFEGVRFGAETDTVGELVFTTGMCGYVETLTDPSYAGQIVMQTYPLIGNYGIIREDFEGACCVKGYVVREYCDTPSNFRTDCDLDTYLKEQGVPGLCGVDTRELTRIIREHGVMNAAICDEIPADLTPIETYAVTGVVEAVSCKESSVHPAEGEERFRVSLLDYGAKRNIVRELQKRGCTVTVLPATTSAEEILAADPDGVMLSNGPGDPAENTYQIEQIRKLLGKVPMFGICLGHQLTALAAGGSTYKLKYGHRGVNQPVRDLNGVRTYITSQNHGYAVDGDTVKLGKVRFVNANDGTCEGIDYPELKAFTVQFHPEACTGPKDTSFLFDQFVELMKGGRVVMPLDTSIKKVLVIGSGPIVIGQAAEFDYAGAQACRILKEAGVDVVLCNSNPATIMTDQAMADEIYLEPLTTETIKRIIKKEKPDSILAGLGGQTGLTLAMQLDKEGFLQEQGVRLLGTDAKAISRAEDRELFKEAMAEIGQPVIASDIAETVEGALEVAERIGYPVIVRPAFTLGGAGGGAAANEAELRIIAQTGLDASPITQILVERAIFGWKEIEFETMRDGVGNVIAVCSMENFDPVGVHTGDSIVVAPTQTLADKEFQMLRKASLDIITHLGIVGGCNVQLALNPDSFEYAVIEVNPRVSAAPPPWPPRPPVIPSPRSPPRSPWATRWTRSKTTSPARPAPALSRRWTTSW